MSDPITTLAIVCEIVGVLAAIGVFVIELRRGSAWSERPRGERAEIIFVSLLLTQAFASAAVVTLLSLLTVVALAASIF